MKATYELNYDDPSRTGPTSSTRTLHRFESVLRAIHEDSGDNHWKRLEVIQRAYSRGAEKGRKAGTVRTTIWTRSKGWIRENLEVHEEDVIKERK